MIGYRHCNGYPGMALALMIVFDTAKDKYLLDLQWMSLGLDLYGDTLQETYVYRFKNLVQLTGYLSEKYQVEVTDIPVKYRFDTKSFPNPIYNRDQEDEFKEAWERFLNDFRNGMFLDSTAKLDG